MTGPDQFFIIQSDVPQNPGTLRAAQLIGIRHLKILRLSDISAWEMMKHFRRLKFDSPALRTCFPEIDLGRVTLRTTMNFVKNLFFQNIPCKMLSPISPSSL